MESPQCDTAAGQGLGGLGGEGDVQREQGAERGVVRCSAGGTSNGEVRGIEAGSPVFLSTIYLKGKHQACPPCPFARISLPTPQSPTTHQKRKKWISDHFGGAWFGVFPHAPGADTPTLVTAHGSCQTNVLTLLIKGR